MSKKQSSLPALAPVPAVDTRPFGQVFLIKKGGTLTPEPGIPDGQEPLHTLLSAHEANQYIFANREAIFGKETVGLTAKIGTASFPFDAFLFDFSNREQPRCFLLLTPKNVANAMLVLLAVKAYLQAVENRAVLIEMLGAHIGKDKAMQKVFKPFILEGSTIEAMLTYVLNSDLRALFLTNEDDQDCIELFTTFAEKYSTMIDIIFLRKYLVGRSKMLSVFPPFADLKEKQEVAVKVPKEKVIHTEDFHLVKSDAVRPIYEKLKAEATKIDKNIVFNPNGKHYIAMKKSGGKNSAFFHFRKTSIYLVVKVEEKVVRKMVKHHEIKTLPESVQKFWNGASTGLIISSIDYLKEIVEVLKKLIKV